MMIKDLEMSHEKVLSPMATLTKTLLHGVGVLVVALILSSPRDSAAQVTGVPVYEVGVCNSDAGEYWDNATQSCVGYNGAEQTGNGWPAGLINAFWNHCDQFSCDGSQTQLWQTYPGDFYCQGGLGDVLVVMGRVTGDYGGWNDRNNFITAAMATQGGNAGSWHPISEWYMPTNLWLRNYQDGGWMNMEFHTICTNQQAVADGHIADALLSLDWLGILALLFLA